MLTNILEYLKETFQSIASESKIKFSESHSVKIKKIWLGVKGFPMQRQNFPTQRLDLPMWWKMAKDIKKSTVQFITD